jgi:Family of unknown function (DUF5906)
MSDYQGGNGLIDTGIEEASAHLASVSKDPSPAPDVSVQSNAAAQQSSSGPGHDQCDPSLALDFLDDFFGTDKRHLVAIRKGQGKNEIKAQHFDASDRAGQQAFIADNGNAGFDLYFSPNPIKGTLHKKASKNDILEARHLWADLDPRENEPLEAERDAMLAVLTINLPVGLPKPNRVIDSGRGFWGYWELDKPAPVDGSRNNMNGPLTEAVECYGRGIEQAFGDHFADGCRNIDRIARLPGTVNTKTGKLASVLREYSHDVAHAIESFPQQAEKPKEPPDQQAGHFKPSDKYDPIDPTDPLVASLDPKWSQPDYASGFAGDRSRAAFGFVCECKRHGISDETIARCLMSWPIGTCLREKPNINRELTRILARANEFTIDPKLAAMNEKHHVVLHGGKTRVLTWDDDEIYEGRKVPVYQTPVDFKAFHSKYRHSYQIQTKVKDENGKETGATETKTITKPLGDWWWEHKERRQYEGLTYAPNTDADIVGGKLNLWTGFTVAPIKGRRHVPYLKHLRDNICLGNRDHYDYLIRLMARAVQFPDQRGEVGVVLIGPKGVGKTVAVDEFGSLFGTHYWTVTNPEHFTGRFNSHLQNCSILLADECLRPENKVHEQIAKTLLTGQTIMIEPKGVNAYQVKNFLHVFICTNAKWAIPATQDERRWFILNVSDLRRKDFSYFRKICDDMAAGGRANLLHYLLHLDLSGFEFRDVPDTEALLEQKERTRNGIDLLVEGWCREGVAPCSYPDKPHVIVTSGSDALQPSGLDNFIHSKAPEDLRRLGPIRIKRALTKDWGTSHFRGRVGGRLVSGIELPPLPALRKMFEDRCNGGQPIKWQGGPDWEASYS